MSKLADDFREIRRVSTPWVCVQTSDYRAVVRELVKVRVNGEDPACLLWTCTEGAVSVCGQRIDLGDATAPPSDVLKAAVSSMPADSMLFWVVPDTFETPNHSMSNPFTIQAIAAVRDAFKADRRTLVVLSIDGKMPPLVSDDVPVLRDPLPSKADIVGITTKLLESTGVKVAAEEVDKAASLCQGMTRFSAEEALSRKLRRKGIDLDGLATAQQVVIEQSSERGLVFSRFRETFDDIGGLDQIKKFSARLFTGERPPSCIVVVEEIEKAMAGSGSGGDTSGVSQDQLGVLLTEMENQDWAGFINVGVPGTGKSLIAKAMGNTYKVPTISLDLGAMKGMYVGQSEGKVRKCLSILKSFAGTGAFFVATSNGLSVIPPELRRRFRYGIWYSDLPLKQERESIWQINLKRFGLAADAKRPADDDFTGSDVRNVCDLASRLRCPLTEAVDYIIPVAKSDPGAVARLRDAAADKFLSTSSPGPYRKPGAGSNGSGRALAL